MGTRSLTHIKENGKTLLTIYRQYDGYPDGHGLELAKFLVNITVVNGFNGDMKMGTHANGMGCLAAQLIGKLKNRLGNIYIDFAGTKSDWVDYVYNIKFDEERGLLINFDRTKYLTPKEFIEKHS